MYPNVVRPGRGRRCARALPSRLGLCPRGSGNWYKKCMNWYKNHTMYKFVLHNLYNNCMNSFVWICTKSSEKKICIRVGNSTQEQNGLQSSCHPHCMNSYYTIRIKNVLIGTKTTLCTNSYYTICITIVWIRLYEFVQKLAKKRFASVNPGPKWLAIVTAACHPPPHRLHQCPFYLYTVQ